MVPMGIWRFYSKMAEDVMSSPSAMMERMMRKVGRNFLTRNNQSV
jgi:hypothetical protein